jgi:hypothetical protein
MDRDLLAWEKRDPVWTSRAGQRWCVVRGPNVEDQLESPLEERSELLRSFVHNADFQKPPNCQTSTTL